MKPTITTKSGKKGEELLIYSFNTFPGGLSGSCKYGVLCLHVLRFLAAHVLLHQVHRYKLNYCNPSL